MVCGDDRAVELTGQNAPIYQLNDDVPIRLNDSTVADYVRFFFAFTRGRHGRFYLIESADDLRFDDDVHPSREDEVASLIQPVGLSQADQDQAFVLDCLFFFQNALFACPVILEENGKVDMTGEKLLREDIAAVPIERIRWGPFRAESETWSDALR